MYYKNVCLFCLHLNAKKIMKQQVDVTYGMTTVFLCLSSSSFLLLSKMATSLSVISLIHSLALSHLFSQL